MAERGDASNEVDRFVLDEIDSVPHLEALLLLWNSRPKPWSVEEMAERLYLLPAVARGILEDLTRKCLAQKSPDNPAAFSYGSDPARDRLVSSVDAAYQHSLVRITTLIHSKPSAALRAFARSFRIKRER